ncbi:endothelin-converting enzyme homolog isoform X2 [Littorina saxatilis]|uniref:Endothelin-converting enzyme 1 n=1 Tax=Littorina saxatilis TaxID=31220 RepID=A0AAN9GHZ2_9CAEN
MGRRNGRTACTEENELLNSNAIKMSDAPFGRSDSEDDIIEDYDDVVNFKGTCCKDRTALERLLLVLIVLLIVVVVGLAVGLTRPEIIPRKDYCKSTQCVQAASTIMAAMDPEADPCQDFFQYACGGWVRQNPIPKGYHKWDRSQELSGQNLYVLKRYLDSDVPLKGKAENKTQTFYRTCIASQKASRQATLQRLRDLVKGVGGWSVSTATQKWHIDTALQRIHRLGAWPLFRIKVDVDERDPTRRYIVKIDLGETVVPTDMYPPLNVPSPPPSTPKPTPRPGTTTANNNNNSDSEQITGMTMPTTPSTTPTTTTTEDPAKVVDRVKKLFVEETVYIMQALGFNSTAARQRARLMADLEHKIAAATEGKAHIHDRFSLYNVLTVGELEANFSMFSWTQYFAVLGLNVNPEDEVVVFHPGYLANLTALISAAQNSPDEKNVLRDYMVVTLVRSFKQYFDPALFDMEELEADSMQEPWKRCTFYTNKALGFATGAIFVRGTGQEGNVDEIQRLISYVRAAFKEFILRKFWIDTKTRLKAEEKVDSIINKISYPGYIMNTSFLDNFYQKFTVSPDNWFDNILNWRTFDRQRANIELMSIPDRQKSWIRPPVTVNAVYSPIRNDVIFPIAMFHLPYYIPNGPKAVNFGAMGSVIGHEITHAFDFQGRQYDAEGRLKDWWDPHSTESFGITTQCMVDQYNNIQVKGNDVDGDFTLDENIADNGGLRAAHYAFMKWLEEVGEEAPLPSLNMTHHQVFFLSYAQMYCSKWTDMGLKLHLLTDPHSPGAARVNGVLANSKTFSWAFQCPVYSTMNAQTKCEVW